jgi:outer membrane exchange protein TraA
MVPVRSAALPLCALLCLSGVALAAPSTVVVSGDPVAPSYTTPGQGLCSAASVSTSPATDFPQQAGTFNTGINAFMESNAANRTTATLRYVTDLSNNNTAGQRLSFGDFISAAIPNCKTGGCDFAQNDTTTSFATRLRGYLNVRPEWVGKSVHFGFYADDAVSLTLFDNAQVQYPVVTRPPVLGAPTWRTTNTVIFVKPGLYPVEILHAAIVEHSALEMSYFIGSFTDFESPANQAGSLNLQANGFTLFPPYLFFQADDGSQAFPNADQCVQCNRQMAGLPGNGGCGPGYRCNNAALCSPCNSAINCGPSCSPCGVSTPVCLNINETYTCVQCNRNSDCGTQVCDLETHTCKECNEDRDCPTGKFCAVEEHECKQCNVDAQCGRGQTCRDHACVSCDTKDACAGASCNCCPGGDDIQCAVLTPGGPPTCVECTADSECGTGKRCDTINGKCVEKVAECNTADKCGPNCVRCPNERPFCMDGQVCVECRNDLECGNGRYCVSGECSPCATDRRCGTRCESCGGDKPFCLSSDGTAERARCVRCLADGDCENGTCDLSTNTCTSSCALTCPDGLVCNGFQCVGCYANSQCPCGGSCDPDTNRCVAECSDSGDCAASEHCTLIAKTCEPGRRKPATEPRGGGLCCGIAGPPTALGVLFALMTVYFFGRRRVR